jgi:hypothetical protein
MFDGSPTTPTELNKGYEEYVSNFCRNSMGFYGKITQMVEGQERSAFSKF